MAEESDRAAAARAARARNREAQRQNEQPDPRTARTPLEREQARVDAATTPAELQEAQRIRVEQTGRRPSVGTTTGTHEMRPGEPSGKQYLIMHGAVGGFTRGSVVHQSKFPETADFDAMLEAGAITEHKSDRADEEEEEARDLLDFDDVEPPTLTEAAFSETKPTMPRTEGLDVTAHEMHQAMREGVGTSGPREDTESEPAKTERDERKAQGGK